MSIEQFIACCPRNPVPRKRPPKAQRPTEFTPEQRRLFAERIRRRCLELGLTRTMAATRCHINKHGLFQAEGQLTVMRVTLDKIAKGIGDRWRYDLALGGNRR